MSIYTHTHRLEFVADVELVRVEEQQDEVAARSKPAAHLDEKDGMEGGGTCDSAECQPICLYGQHKAHTHLDEVVRALDALLLARQHACSGSAQRTHTEAHVRTQTHTGECSHCARAGLTMREAGAAPAPNHPFAPHPHAAATHPACPRASPPPAADCHTGRTRTWTRSRCQTGPGR